MTEVPQFACRNLGLKAKKILRELFLQDGIPNSVGENFVKYTWNMKKVAIVGAAGFIGARLVSKLKSENFDVFELDLVNKSGSLNYRYLDLKKSDVMKILSEIQPDIVIHLAAQTSVLASFEDTHSDMLVNALGTLKLVESAINVDCDHFIYINSGGAIYSRNSNMPIKEDSIVKPESPYGLSKLTGESYLELLSNKHGMQWSSLALSNCYGPVIENPKGVIFEFWNAIRKSVTPYINGIEVTRDFIYIDDVVDAIFLTISRPTCCRVNISSGVETSILEVFELISKEMNFTVTPDIRPHISGEVFRSVLDNSLAHELLGWTPKIPIREGISISIARHMESTQ